MAIYQQTMPREDTVQKRGLTQQDIQFLKDLQHTLNTQDTMCQRDPRFWVIKGTRIVSCDEENSDIIELVDVDGNVVASDLPSAARYIQENLTDELKRQGVTIKFDVNKDSAYITVNIVIDSPVESREETEKCFSMYDIKNLLENFGYDSYRLAFSMEEDYIYPDTLFLTHRGAESHLRQNAHNYSADAHAYAMTATRSPVVEHLWKLLQTIDFDSLETVLAAPNAITQDEIIAVLDEEANDIQNMSRDPDENEASYNVRKLHFRNELKAIRMRLLEKFQKDD